MTYQQMATKVIKNREKLLKTSNLDEKRRLIRENHELMKKMDSCWTSVQGKPVWGKE